MADSQADVAKVTAATDADHAYPAQVIGSTSLRDEPSGYRPPFNSGEDYPSAVVYFNRIETDQQVRAVA